MRVMIGAPCYGMVQALTAQSLWDMAARGAIVVPGGDEYEFELHPFAMGPYVQNNLIGLLKIFESDPSFDYFLRFDADMVWNGDWVDRFFARHSELVEQLPELEKGRPLIHGGVYPRRQRVQNYVPIVQWLSDEQPVTDEQFVEKSRRCYMEGRTHPAARVGGGWCLFNRAAAQLPVESWYVTEGIGEDYGGCDAVIRAGGNVFATWPQNGGPLLGHAIQGLDYATIMDYLTAWNLSRGIV